MVILLFILILGFLALLFNQIILAILCAVLSIMFLLLLFIAGKRFEYFYWEDGSNPKFPSYYKKNNRKLRYKIAKFLYAQYLHLAYYNEQRKGK